ncbi:MAG: prepilin-type N-terminal cleavage/methylation domain-containing protein [Kiritimatiellales bacterium]
MKTNRKHQTGRKGFTLVEIMLVISIIGFLSAIGIPSILNAYANSLATAKDRNIAEVEKAKGVLTLPSELGMRGAMSLTVGDPFDDEAISNLCAALRIRDVSELTVGGISISIGDLTTKAYY